MNIVIDENIAYAEEAFSAFGNVKLLHGRKITNDQLKDADALIVRSITKVNKELLDNTHVKFVGTATIGTDHIDLDYLKEKKINFSDAKGCNADAVAEYIFTSILNLAKENNIQVRGKTLGIVGVGNIGSRIARLAKAVGMDVLKNDPPLKRLTGSDEYVFLDNIYDADIITLHVPLNSSGIDNTVHLFNNENLNKLKDNTILLNASRGQVIDNSALSELIKPKKLNVVLDVWENEPDINVNLLSLVKIGTPHIAGYSFEGKLNGTVMIYNALCEAFNEKPLWVPDIPNLENNSIDAVMKAYSEEFLFEIFNSIYDIRRDDKETRMIENQPAEQRPVYFDRLRKNYPLRREFTNYKISLKSSNKELERILKAFRFQLIYK